MKKSRRTYNGVHLNKKSNTQDVVEQSLTIMQNIRANTLIIGANNNPINKKVRLNADFSINYKKTALLFAHL